MTPLPFAALATAGGLGAATRYIFDGLIRSRIKTVFPWATFAINVSGSLALGLLAAWAAGSVLSAQWSLVLGTGFLGGYTTFSTASHESVRLLAQRRYVASLTSMFATLIVCVGAAALGWWAGTGWTG